MPDTSGMATQLNLAALLKQDLKALTRMGELQGQFMKAWVSIMGKATLPKYSGTGPDALEIFLKHAKDNMAVFPGLPSAAILRSDLFGIRELLKEAAVCELLLHEPEVFLVTFPSGYTFAMVNDEADLASCKSSNDVVPGHPAVTDQEVSNNIQNISSEPVEQISIIEKEPTESIDVQPSASIVQPKDAAELTLELEAASDGIAAHSNEVHTGLTPTQEESFFLCPEMETSILEAEVHAAIQDINFITTPSQQTTDDILHQKSTHSYQVTDSDQVIIASIESDSQIFNGNAIEESAPVPTVPHFDDFDFSLDFDGIASETFETAPYAMPATNSTGPAHHDGAACSILMPEASTGMPSDDIDGLFNDHEAAPTPAASVQTFSDNIDGLSNNHDAAPSTPKLAPYAVPASSSNINGSLNSRRAVLSTPEPTPFATPSLEFDTLTESDEAVPATPTPAPRPSPMHRSRANGGLPTYGDMAKEAFYNYKGLDRPANMIKFDHIYQYAEETYPAIKGKGESYKSGFRHAVPKAFVKVPDEQKPNSSLWWTLDLVNFPGDNSARNRRKRRVPDSVPPETPSKKPKKNDAQGNVKSVNRPLAHGMQNVQKPIFSQQQGFFYPQPSSQQNHQQLIQQSIQQHYLQAPRQVQSTQVHNPQQHLQRPTQQQKFQSFDKQLQQYIEIKSHELARQVVHREMQQRFAKGQPTSALEEALWYQNTRMGAKQKMLAGLGASR